ncbi:hypothetical protein [Vibrio crassostreae]|uniref:hypothetical protein n=1 Tax=Vibrio crassostreae TaxID=246167 RepID=UPI001B30042E|nr:hypothetical protein [Vibrio crassostreae]
MNAIQWINENLENPQELSPRTLETLGDFTLMWALFEASEGEERNNMLGQITNCSNRLASVIPIDLIEIEFDYWKARYVNNSTPTAHYNKLRLSDDRQRDLVLKAFSDDVVTLRDKLEACLLVVYRYRNNMFHGMKDVRKLNGQESNFSHAISFLQKILPYGHTYWLGFPRL